MSSPDIRGWRRLLFPASLLLNLFLVALIGGHFLRVRHQEKATPSLMRALQNAEAVLSPDDAAAFGAIWRRDAPHYGDLAKTLEQARGRLEQAITADPYDKAAVQQALEDWQGDWGQFAGQARLTLVDALAGVSPEGRRKLVEQRRRAVTGG